MSRIFFDTNLFIYLLDGGSPRSARVNGIIGRMSERRDEMVTSALTLGELLVRPLALGDTETAMRCEELLSGPGISIIDFDRDAARIYAEIRQDKSLKAPDAMQLACAARAGCDLFITNDDHLSRKIVPGIQFIASLDHAWL